MSIAQCHQSEHGMHNFVRVAGQREMACKWCSLTHKQVKERGQQVARDHLEQAKKQHELSPEHIAELDAMRPYRERRKRFDTMIAGMSNLAASHFESLPAPVPADVRGEAAEAAAALKKAIAAVSHPEIRELLFFAYYMTDCAHAMMEKRMAEFQQKKAAEAPAVAA